MGSRSALHSAPTYVDLTLCGRSASSGLVQQTRPVIRNPEQQCPGGRGKATTIVRSFSSVNVVVDWPLQAALFGLLFSYACYIERPRGWADSSLIEVHHLFRSSDVKCLHVSKSIPSLMQIGPAGQRLSRAWQVGSHRALQARVRVLQ